MFSPDHQEARLAAMHPILPFGVGVDIGAVVVEHVALNVGLPRLTEKSKFIGPQIRVIAIHVGIVPDMGRGSGNTTGLRSCGQGNWRRKVAGFAKTNGTASSRHYYHRARQALASFVERLELRRLTTAVPLSWR